MAQDGLLPKIIGKTNSLGAPVVSQLCSAVVIKAFIVVFYLNESTYTTMVQLATSLYLLPYVFSALYLLFLSTGENRHRTQDGNSISPAPRSARPPTPPTWCWDWSHSVLTVAAVRRRAEVRPAGHTLGAAGADRLRNHPHARGRTHLQPLRVDHRRADHRLRVLHALRHPDGLRFAIGRPQPAGTLIPLAPPRLHITTATGAWHVDDFSPVSSRRRALRPHLLLSLCQLLA